MRRRLFAGTRGRLLLLLALALGQGLLYALVIPPWQAPDETGHFEAAWLLAHQGRLPSPDSLSPAFERELISSLYAWRYGDFTGRPLPDVMPVRIDDLPAYVFARQSRTVLAGRFSLAYLWQALFLLPVRNQDLVLQLYTARLSSVLLNAGIVALVFAIISEMAPASPGLALATALLVALLPMHTFINSAVGDGPLAELLACLVLYCWVRLFGRGARPRLIVAIAFGTLAAVLSKATAAYLVPLDLYLAAWWFARRQTPLWSRRRVVYVGIGLAALGSGAWLASHSTLGATTLKAIQAQMSSSSVLLADVRGYTLDQAMLGAFDSFWANFGWMAVPASARWYGALLMLIILAALGWLGSRKDEQGVPSWAPAMMTAAFLAALGVFVWTVIAPASGLYQNQGRYLFPAVVPFAFLLVGGWRRLAAATRQTLVSASLLTVAVFDAWCVIGYIVPYFYYR